MAAPPKFKTRTRYLENADPTRSYGMDTVNNFINVLEAKRKTEFDDLLTQTLICLMVAADLLAESHRKLRNRVDELEARAGNLEGAPHRGPRIGG
jgi:hypothetical protein